MLRHTDRFRVGPEPKKVNTGLGGRHMIPPETAESVKLSMWILNWYYFSRLSSRGSRFGGSSHKQLGEMQVLDQMI
jgi:hypothetical protein